MRLTFRKPLIHAYSRLRGHTYLRHLQNCLRLDAKREVFTPMVENLRILLEHCRRFVPYYSNLMPRTDSPFDDPYADLATLPILTKAAIRDNFERLQSSDINVRRCYFNTSGGSTGEPIRLIQDREYSERSRAVTIMFSKWANKDIGDLEIRLWGSERDVFTGTAGMAAQLRNRGTNMCILNAFRMTPVKMREYLGILNRRWPTLIVAYAQAIYELAKFAEQEGIAVVPQRAILTSAGTLYGFMRTKIETVFKTKVFNRYGSREVGDIASECDAHQHLHLAPLGNLIEIVDDGGNRVPAGVEGNILVTCLTNFAMPLVRYQIGDRGVLSEDTVCGCGRPGPMLKAVLGRNVDAFRTADGTLVDGEYFTHLLYFRDWVKQFQVIQKDFGQVEYRIVSLRPQIREQEAAEIISKTKLVLGAKCQVTLRLVDEILPSPSGKYRYTISEVTC